MNDKVYIHELIDIVGHNRDKYMHHMTANWCPVGREERNQLCYGVWATVGSTGDWPQVVNLWELDGWDGLAANFAHEFAGGGRTQDPSLAEWWAAAAGLRRGGVDRIVVPAPWAPTIDELLAANTRGVAYAHELVTMPAGGAPAYLGALADTGRAALETSTTQLLGAFRVAMVDDSEVIALWAFADWEAWTAFERRHLALGPDDPWTRARRSVGAHVKRTLMVDAPLGPLRLGRQPQTTDRRPLAEV